MKDKKTYLIIGIVIIVFTLFISVILILNKKEQSNSDLVSGVEQSDVSDKEISNIPEKTVERGWVINKLGYTYLYNDRALSQFNGTARTAIRYANAVNKVTETINSPQIFNIIVPTQTEFIDIPAQIRKEDNFFCTSQGEAAYIAASNMLKAKNIDVFDIIYAHLDEYLYFRTDNNWTMNAAYYAYSEYCKALEMEKTDIENYEKITLHNYLGRFYTATQSKMLLDNRDYIVYYRTEAEYPFYITVEQNGNKTYLLKYYGTEISSDKGYDVFIGKERASYRFDTRSDGGTLTVVGDSSAHPFLPFLMAHYSVIYFYNPACFETDNINVPETDTVLFMAYSTNANDPEYCKNLEGIKFNG